MNDFEEWMRVQGLRPSTRARYARIVRQIDKNPIAWLKERVGSDTSIGTVLPLRAAVRNFLLFRGYSVEEVDAALPPARGRPSEMRQPLSPAQFRSYLDSCAGLSNPYRTMLILLPYTGLRIGELCNLRREDLTLVQGVPSLVFRGKGGKVRQVPLSDYAHSVLVQYMQRELPEDHIFVDLKGPVKPEHVRTVMRHMREIHKDLGPIIPHIMRHTFATEVLRAGADMKTLQQLLGHSSIVTTSRYAHPDTDMMRKAVNGIAPPPGDSHER